MAWHFDPRRIFLEGKSCFITKFCHNKQSWTPQVFVFHCFALLMLQGGRHWHSYANKALASFCSLTDWLIDRRHVNFKWQTAALAIREKINLAIQDMPEVDEIKQLLAGTCKANPSTKRAVSMNWPALTVTTHGSIKSTRCGCSILMDSAYNPNDVDLRPDVPIWFKSKECAIDLLHRD